MGTKEKSLKIFNDGSAKWFECRGIVGTELDTIPCSNIEGNVIEIAFSYLLSVHSEN